MNNPERIKLLDKSFRRFIPNEDLMKAIDGVAERLNADFSGKNEVPIILSVLNGAIPFTAALLTRLDFDCELVSIKVSSYEGTKSTGTVLIPMGLTGSVTDRTVIIVDDIIDTGTTIVALKDLLLGRGAKSVKICGMLLKPDVYKKKTKLDYIGMEIPNAFIVGFGLDYNELGRQYKDIYIIDE